MFDVIVKSWFAAAKIVQGERKSKLRLGKFVLLSRRLLLSVVAENAPFYFPQADVGVIKHECGAIPTDARQVEKHVEREWNVASVKEVWCKSVICLAELSRC